MLPPNTVDLSLVTLTPLASEIAMEMMSEGIMSSVYATQNPWKDGFPGTAQETSSENGQTSYVPQFIGGEDSKLTFTAADGNITVNGTLKYVKNWTGFNGDPSANENNGYYLPLMFKAPEGIDKSSTISVRVVNGSRDKTFDAKVLDEVQKDSQTEYYFTAFLYVDVDNNTAKNTPTFTVDWDGSGAKYSETTYTLNLNGLTLETETASGNSDDATE